MSKSKTVKKDLYYTKDHEWVDFQGTVAYIGVCHLKLTGIAFIGLTQPYERKGLMQPEQYKLFTKRKF